MAPTIQIITTLEIPELKPYLTLKDQNSLFDQGVFVAEGDNVVERLLASSISVKSLLVSECKLPQVTSWLLSKTETITVYTASERILSEIVGFRFHNGIMALGTIPPSFTPDQIYSQPTNRNRLFVALDDLANVENVGVISRNCAAAGVSALISGSRSVNPYLRRAVRNSMGTIFKIPVIQSCDLSNDLQLLKERGCTIVAAHVRPQSIPVYNLDKNGDICLVLGNEYQGISEKIIPLCDSHVYIPMANGVDSYNVACASAIILYEITRGLL